MAVPYKLNYFEIESGLGTTSTFLHKGDLTANRIIKIGGTSNDILLGDGSTGSLSGKQNTITLTTSGTSGAATLIGATLNIPQYTDQFVGTVTSVGLTSSTSGVTISSSPITTSGNIVLSIATASGSQNGLLSSADWATFNNKTSNLGTVTSVAALTLGTTGTDLSSTVANSTTTPVITLNVPTASATNRGALSSTDWSTFNAKQPAGNYITSLTGEATASGPGAASVTLDNTAVIGKVLTGLNVTGGTVISTDSILTALGKVQNQINGLIGGSIFQGTWDANTNTPALTSSVGTNGHYYIVSVAGTTNLNGITDWKVGDWAIFAGTTWQKVDNTDAVASVNGYTGTVSLVTGDVLEGAGSLPSRPSQLYFTDARARAAISLTTSGTSGAATYDNGTGVLNIPNYGSALTAYVPYTGATQTLALGTNNGITLTDTSTNVSINITSSSTGSGAILVNKSGTGTGIRVDNNGTGFGFYANNSSTGSGIVIGNLSTGKGLYIDNAAAATGDPFVYTLGGGAFVKAKIDYLGNITGNSFIKSGGLSSQFLKADGSVDSTAYQGAITLTTTGSSGASTLIGNTLNIPNYSPDLSGYVTLNTAQTITAAKTFTTSGGSDTLIINHSSGSGIGLSITKGGNGEGLYVNKTSGTGNAATIIGTLNATTLVKSGGTSSQFLKADGSVDSTSYQPLLSDPVTGIGVTNYVPKFSALSLIGISQIYDNGTNVGINTSSPSFKLDVNGTGRFTGQLTLGSTITNGTYTYTLPSATGTLALTSALSAYLPLSGGTLTGALFGTTASFASSIGLTSASSSSSLTSTTNGIEISVDGSTTSNKNTIFKVGSSETMRIDASGNLGLGVTPSAWEPLFKVIQLGNNGASISGNTPSYSATPNINVANNYYLATDETNKYYRNGTSGRYRIVGNEHRWETAPSGTAGNAISFTQAMTLDASGNLLVGGTTALGSASGRGNITINGASTSIISLGTAGAWSGYVYHDSTNMTVSNVKSGSLFLATGDVTRLAITSAGNVGIGTTSPTFKLEVSGAGSFSGASAFSDSTSVATGDAITINSSSATSGSGLFGSGLIFTGVGLSSRRAAIVPVQGTADNDTLGLAFFTHPSATGSNPLVEAMRINYLGNVGIGTTSPNYSLQVNSSTTTTRLQITNSTTGTSSTNGFQIIQDGNNNTLSLKPSGFMSFETNNTEAMRITSTGNVGIGTTSPVTNLEVSARDAILRISDVKSASAIGEVSSSLQFWASDPSVASGSNASRVRASINTIFESASGSVNSLTFNVNDGTASGLPERMVITSGGNVGIGIDNPISKLDVRSLGAGEILNLLYLSADAAATGGATAALLVSAASNLIKFTTQTSDSLSFETNGANERMRITSAGNVGIGTTSPSEIFHVNKNNAGNIVGGYFTNSQANTGAESVSLAFGLNRSGGDFVRQIKAITFGAEQQWTGTESTVDGYLSFSTVQNEAVSERMRITSGGNVGIGTTAPNLKLFVRDDINGEGGLRIRNANSGTAASAMFRMNNDNGADDASQVLFFLNSSTRTNDGGINTFTIRNGLGDIRVSSAAGGNVLFMTSKDDERMRITSAGNVGIGTTNPNVSGIEISRNTGSVSPIPAELRISTSTNPPTADWSSTLPWGRLSFYSNDASVGGAKIHAALDVISTGTTGGLSNLVFSLAQSTTGALVERMRLSATGNLGIGTASPTFKLDVVGTGRFSDTISTTNGTVNNLLSYTTTDGIIGTQSNHGVVIRTNNLNRLTIESSGAATFSSSVTASSLIKSGGTSSQYLMADGSTKTIGASGSGTISGTGVLTFSGTGLQSNFDTGIVYQSTLTDFNTLMVVTPITTDAGSYLYSLYFIDQGGGLFTYGIVFSLAPASGTNNIKFNYILTQIPK